MQCNLSAQLGQLNKTLLQNTLGASLLSLHIGLVSFALYMNSCTREMESTSALQYCRYTTSPNEPLSRFLQNSQHRILLIATARLAS